MLCKLLHPSCYRGILNILLFSAEQISPVTFYYVQDVYQKNQLGTRLGKKHIIPGVNIICGKASLAGIKGAGGTLSPSAGNLGSGSP